MLNGDNGNVGSDACCGYRMGSAPGKEEAVSDLVVREALGPVDWEAGGRIYNWRNYVGPKVRALWDDLNPELRIAIALDAFELASREELE